MRSSFVFVACGLMLLVVSTPALPQAAKEAKPAADGYDVVFLGETRPILLRMHVEVNGKAIKTVWRDYLKKWFDYLDRDISGSLDAKEIMFAPSEQAMLQIMRQGNFLQQRNQPMRVADFNKDKNNITFDDFVAYYERRRLGAIQLSGGGGQGGAQIGDALFRLLDKNDDGKLSQKEIADAVQVLMKLDTDDDEFVSANEIAPNNRDPLAGLIIARLPVAQPGQVSKSFYPVAGKEDVGLAALLLATYDRNKDGKLSRTESGLPKDVFERIDTDKDGQLDATELTRWHQRPADFTYTVRLGKTEAAPLELMPVADKKLAKAASNAGRAQLLALGDAQIQLTADASAARGQVQVALIRNQLLLFFQQADIKKQGFLELKDLQQNRVLQILAPLFPLLDRDGDGKLTEKELREYILLQVGATECFTNLSITEHGRNLFKLLDANGRRPAVFARAENGLATPQASRRRRRRQHRPERTHPPVPAQLRSGPAGRPRGGRVSRRSGGGAAPAQLSGQHPRLVQEDGPQRRRRRLRPRVPRR
jgi:Ca2+-binding EF-hand superfamily protein